MATVHYEPTVEVQDMSVIRRTSPSGDMVLLRQTHPDRELVAAH